MHIARDTLDDVMLALYPVLLAQEQVIGGNRDPFREIVGVLVEIASPRARLSRTETRGKAFSALGELLWYLTRDNRLDFVQRYIPRYKQESEDGVTVRGGYGPRLFGQRGHDQVANVVELLRARPTTKRAVIQLFDAEDTAGDHREVPCTTTFQFLVRDELLHMVVTMRSTIRRARVSGDGHARRTRSGPEGSTVHTAVRPRGYPCQARGGRLHAPPGHGPPGDPGQDNGGGGRRGRVARCTTARVRPTVMLPVLQSELAATKGALGGVLAEHRSWLGRPMQVLTVTSVLTLGVAVTVLGLLLLPSLPLGPGGSAVYLPAMVGLIVLAFGLIVSRFI